MKEKLKKILYTPKGKVISARFNERWLLKNHPDLADFIFKETSHLKNSSISERIYCVLNDVKFTPLCKTCGKEIPFKRDYNKHFCSSNCAKADPLLSTKRKAQWKTIDKLAANSKRRISMKEKYGVEFNSQRPEVKAKGQWNELSKTNPNAYQKLSDKNWLNNEYNVKGLSAVEIGEALNVYYGTVLDYCKLHNFAIRKSSNTSKEERKLTDYLSTLRIDFVSSCWNVLNNGEIDIYIPDFKLGIEVDGLYWHSRTLDKNKHLQKTMEAESKGVTLLHFTDEQINSKFDIVKSIIASKLNLTRKIYARQCRIVELSASTAREFFEKTHIQGNASASVKLGLMHNGELVSAMTFSKPRFSKHDWELIRFSSKLNCTVIGGASKLLSHFKKNHIGSIVTYADKMRSNGKLYSCLGFTFSHKTQPGYYWTDGNQLLNRQKFQKHKLVNVKGYSPDLSESEIMEANGYRKFYDCGQLVFEML